MMNKIKVAAISAVVALGALAAVPAHADSFYFGIGPNGPRGGIIVDQGHSYHRPDRWDRNDRWDRHDRNRWDRGCSTAEAVRKADRMGIHRARVRNVSRHSIRVSGRSHGRYVTVSFSRAPNCPIVR
jgi:hypothetical protein